MVVRKGPMLGQAPPGGPLDGWQDRGYDAADGGEGATQTAAWATLGATLPR